jgi:glycerol-3-phosphate dehydrogenase (NAD(P)+)
MLAERQFHMKITVIGAGTWGLSLAQVLCDNGQDVTVYANQPEVAKDLRENRRASKVFANHTFPETLAVSEDFDCAIKDAKAIVLSVPTEALESVLTQLRPHLTDDMILINTAKGFGRTHRRLPCETIAEYLPDYKGAPVALVGPSHAEEVVERMLTCICAVSADVQTAKTVQHLFSNDYLRVYAGNDPLGSEVGAAVKNVIAIAAGMCDGLGIGRDNAKAALVSRGLCEILRYGTKKGGKKDTFFGLTGLGDLIVTCFSVHSRNYCAGLQIGKADSAKQFLEENTKTVEGVFSCRVIAEDAKAIGVEMPLVQAVYDVLFSNQAPSEAVKQMMRRELKEETFSF